MLKLVLGTRDWNPPPRPPGWQIQGEEAGSQAAAIGVYRRGFLRSISAYFPHLFPKSLSPGFQMRAMGCHREKGVIRNMRTCPCPHCSRAIAGKVDWAKPSPLWRRHSVISEGEAEKNTPQERETVVTTCSPSLIPLRHPPPPHTEGVEGQSPHLFSLSRHKERLELMRKGENGTKYLFLSNELCGGNLFEFGKSKWRTPREGTNPGMALFFLSQPSHLGKRAKSKRGSRNLSLRLLYVLLGAGV